VQNVSQLGEAASVGGFILDLDLEAALLLLVHGIEQEFVHFCRALNFCWGWPSFVPTRELVRALRPMSPTCGNGKIFRAGLCLTESMT
jgi:hypothetical protein